MQESRLFQPYIARRRHFQLAAFALAAAAIVFSAFHFWPFPDNRLWQLFMPANSVVLLWCGAVAASVVLAGRGLLPAKCLPPVSVIAFLCVACMSIGVAPDAVRATTYVSKLALGYLGAYTLFRYVAARGGALVLYRAGCVALAAAVACCLVAKATGVMSDFGVFDDAHKYGTYVGVLSVFCATVMLGDNSSWKVRFLGVATVAAAAASIGSLGGLAAIVAGLVVCIALTSDVKARRSTVCALVCTFLVVAVVWQTVAGAQLRSDAVVREPGGVEIRQRYLEWQAQVNLLEARTASGAGVGCINALRGMYYNRLPKLNTMGPFEQNGWLAIPAETGVLGLVCFCAMVWHHAAKGLKSLASGRALRGEKMGLRIGCIAALAAACVAHFFSSLHYNGVLIVFVLILALIDGADDPVKASDGD